MFILSRPAMQGPSGGKSKIVQGERTERVDGDKSLKFWPAFGIALIQTFLLSAHWFIFHTVVSFWNLGTGAQRGLAAALLVLAFSFVSAALLGYRFTNPVVEALYKVAAVWLGLLNFLFWATWLIWAIDLPLRWSGVDSSGTRAWIAGLLYGGAVLVSVYGILNARNIRERRVDIALPNLPENWRGRTALLISDIHLGNVNGQRFAEKVAGIARRLNPAIIFIAGDLFDGSKVHADRVTAPLMSLNPPLGVYFCGGNHEDFGDPVAYE